MFSVVFELRIMCSVSGSEETVLKIPITIVHPRSIPVELARQMVRTSLLHRSIRSKPSVQAPPQRTSSLKSTTILKEKRKTIFERFMNHVFPSEPNAVISNARSSSITTVCYNRFPEVITVESDVFDALRDIEQLSDVLSRRCSMSSNVTQPPYRSQYRPLSRNLRRTQKKAHYHNRPSSRLSKYPVRHGRTRPNSVVSKKRALKHENELIYKALRDSLGSSVHSDGVSQNIPLNNGKNRASPDLDLDPILLKHMWSLTGFEAK
jgi:hypothetical protein